MSKLPRWEDVKDHPEDRVGYHKTNFDELVTSVDILTKEMLAKATTALEKITVEVLRLNLDGMVKCFEMLYYDVAHGCPNWHPAQWVHKDTLGINLSLAELGCIRDALVYSKAQIHDSSIVVFEGMATHNEDGSLDYDDAGYRCALEIVTELITTVDSLLAHDGGIVTIED